MGGRGSEREWEGGGAASFCAEGNNAVGERTQGGGAEEEEECERKKKKQCRGENEKERKIGGRGATEGRIKANCGSCQIGWREGHTNAGKNTSKTKQGRGVSSLFFFHSFCTRSPRNTTSSVQCPWALSGGPSNDGDMTVKRCGSESDENVNFELSATCAG